MIQLHYINPTGCFSWGTVDKIPLEGLGIVSVKGKNIDKGGSNGSGKSSLFNAICVTLYGDCPIGVKDALVCNAFIGGMSSRVEFTSWEDIRYRVTCCRDWKTPIYDNDIGLDYKGTSIFFEKLVDEVWVDCRGKSMAETRQSIVQAIGLTYDQLVSISYMNHRTGAVFLQGTSKDRLDTLLKITGSDKWDAILEKVRGLYKESKKSLQELENRSSFLNGSLTSYKEQINFIKIDEDQLEKVKKDITDLSKSIENDKSVLTNLSKELEIVSKELKKPIDVSEYSSRESSIVAKKTEIGVIKSSIMDLHSKDSVGKDLTESIDKEKNKKRSFEYDLKCKKDSLNSKIPYEKDEKDLEYESRKSLIESEYASDKYELASFRKNMELFEKSICPTCGAALPEDRKKELSSSIEKLKWKCERHEEDLKIVNEEYKNYMEGKIKEDRESFIKVTQGSISGIELEIDKVGKKITKFEKELVNHNNNKNKELQKRLSEEVEEPLKALNEELITIVKERESYISSVRGSIEKKKQELDSKVVVIKSEVLNKENSIEFNKKWVVGIEKDRERYNELSKNINQLLFEVEQNESSCSDLNKVMVNQEWLIKNIPFIKLHKVSDCTERLSNYVNSYLESMGDSIRVNITSFDKKSSVKSGADIKEFLKAEIKVEVVDGEKVIDSKLYSDGETSKISNALVRGMHDLAVDYGYGCNILILDEIFGFVDADNSYKIAESFRNVPEGHSVFVTDNSGIVDNILNSDVVWTVVKERDFTRLEV
jgi:DNA repair exonuclease SbcCD ATPase subunit